MRPALSQRQQTSPVEVQNAMTHLKSPNQPRAWHQDRPGIVDAKHVPGVAIGDAGSWLGRSLRTAVQTLRTWRRNRKAMNELAQCSDWMLADIGIRRDEIRDTLRRDAERSPVVAANPARPAVFDPHPSNDRVARKVA